MSQVMRMEMLIQCVFMKNRFFRRLPHTQIYTTTHYKQPESFASADLSYTINIFAIMRTAFTCKEGKSGAFQWIRKHTRLELHKVIAKRSIQWTGMKNIPD